MRISAGRAVLLTSMAALMLGAVVGCGSSGGAASKSSGNQSNGTGSSGTGGSSKLVIGYEASATSLDPGQVTDINTMQVLSQMYNTLVKFNSAGKIAKDLAASWKESKNHLTYTFTLRQGVKFSNGDPMTAKDVVFSFERQINKSNSGYKYGPFPFSGFYFGDIVSVKALSTSKVQFTLKKPEGAFLSILTTPTAGIVDKKTALSEGKKFAKQGAGTGPFMLANWNRGVDLKMKPNPYYWGTKPKLKELDWTPITNQVQRAQDLQSGSVDLVISPQPSSIKQLQSKGFKVAMDAGPHIWYVGLNLSKKPFNNPLVRQALNYAINRKAIISGILHGTGSPADQPLAPMQLGYNSNVNSYSYNPKKAKSLLKKAGYPNGFSTTFLVPSSGSGMQSPKQMGTAIQGYLAAVGIKVKIKEMDWGSFLNRINQGAKKANADMWELSWMDSPLDPSLVLDPLFAKSSWPPGFNSGYYSDPQVNSLLAQGKMLSNPSKRKKIYQQVESLINKDAPWIFVDHAKQVVAYNSRVQGFHLNKMFPFLIHLNDVSVK